jgi:nitrite reductase/ring-hydroxylating ferredoxin subunit/uncharacterized membrane protein
MRSTAHFRGHPIHPSLIPFPFAFLWGAFGFDIAGRLLDRSSLWQTGRYLGLAGVITALIAAVPGFIDYFTAVPPNSSARERATKHMVLNLATVAAFVLAAFLRRHDVAPPGGLVLLLETAGAAMLTVAGWLGGVLVSRNQISVDHRYAGAGKWKDVTIEPKPGRPVVVAGVDELEVNQMKLVRVHGKRIVVGRTEDGYVAFADGCTHKGGPLSDGALICGTVQCPWHGSQFDVHTGAVKAGPTKKSIEVYGVREENGEIVLELGG